MWPGLKMVERGERPPRRKIYSPKMLLRRPWISLPFNVVFLIKLHTSTGAKGINSLGLTCDLLTLTIVLGPRHLLCRRQFGHNTSIEKDLGTKGTKGKNTVKDYAGWRSFVRAQGGEIPVVLVNEFSIGSRLWINDRNGNHVRPGFVEQYTLFWLFIADTSVAMSSVSIARWNCICFARPALFQRHD